MLLFIPRTASFTANAVIHSGRWQHHRLRDHFGVESTLYVVLNERIGPWEEGTPVHFVIDDLLARMANLESTSFAVARFTCNAYLLAPGVTVEQPAGTLSSFAWADSILQASTTRTFPARAWITGGGSLTADAIISGQSSFTASAVLV